MTKYLLLQLSVIVIMYWSCTTDSQNSQKSDGETKSTKDSIKFSSFNKSDTIDNNIDNKSLVYTKYNLPLPVETYRILKNEKFGFNPDILHDIDKSSLYQTTIEKAFNLGVYSADLAYCSVFDKSQKVIDYYNVTKKMANDLEIGKGYDEAFLKRLMQNFDNNDSLVRIANQSYWQSCTFLEENNKINIMPFVVVGAWIETLHLAVLQYNISKENLSISSEILKQLASLKSIINYLYDVMVDSNAFYINKDIKDLLKKLEDLSSINSMISDSQKKSLTKYELTKISDAITQIRNFYINK